MQAGGHEFESHHLHLVSLIIKKELEKPFDSKENQNRKQRKGEATDWYIENCILNIENDIYRKIDSQTSKLLK